MCRTGGRRCPSHSNPVMIAARNARRREQYAKRKHPHTQTGTEDGQTTGLTPTQTAYFQNTVAKTSDGKPLPLYHGSSTDFNTFNPDLLGQGNDAWGNGFYFTDHKSVAEGYASDSGSADANVKEFYLNLQNPIRMDGVENMSLIDYTFDAETAAKILKKHPDAHIQPDNEDGDMSFLGDYSATYWDKTHHTPEEIDHMIDEVAEEHFQEASWVELENIFGKEYGAAYLNAVHAETGHDGVIVDFGDGESKHYVAWFPNQMKLTSNVNPEDDSNF